MNKSKIIINNTVVEKYDDAANLKIEFRKMINARNLGLESNLFYVPEVYYFDEAEGVLKMEKIKYLEPILNKFNNLNMFNRLVESAALSLSLVHDKLDLNLNENQKKGLPSNYENEESKSYIHGDYNLTNLCVSEEKPGKIIIIDWQTTKMHGGCANYATAFFDVSWFINHLYNRYLNYAAIGGKLDKVALKFLNVYFNENKKYGIEEFIKYNKKFIYYKTNERRSKYSMIKNFLLTPGSIGWNNFQNTLERK
jgi:hypothetical protein